MDSFQCTSYHELRRSLPWVPEAFSRSYYTPSAGRSAFGRQVFSRPTSLLSADMSSRQACGERTSGTQGRRSHAIVFIFIVPRWARFPFTSDSVHTFPFSFENATFSLRIGLPSTPSRWKRWPKTQLFENALQGGNFWKLRFRVFVWTVKTELLENDDVTVLEPAYSAREKPK